MRTTVVYVHGLWMTGLEGEVLRRRLAWSLDARAPIFAYRSATADVAANALRLAVFLAKLQTDTLHLVGHSLGGLIILRSLESKIAQSLPPGRVVILGSPLSGSRAAHSLARWRFGKFIMGRTAREELLQDHVRQWRSERELGIIAGSRQVGLGRIVNQFDASSDGTIFVDETYIEGMKQHLIMNVSHSGMPFSQAVAQQTANFLAEGRFQG
jgi:Alpha/beta hydrolase family